MNKKLIRLLSLALAAVMVFSLCACNGATTEEETTTTIPYSDQAIKDGDVAKAELVAKFNKLMADTKASTEFEGINYWLDQSAGDCECENEYVKASFKTLADKRLPAVPACNHGNSRSAEDQHYGNYGDDISYCSVQHVFLS